MCEWESFRSTNKQSSQGKPAILLSAASVFPNPASAKEKNLLLDVLHLLLLFSLSAWLFHPSSSAVTSNSSLSIKHLSPHITSPSTHPSIFFYLCLMQDDLFNTPPQKKPTSGRKKTKKKKTGRQEFLLNLDDTSCHPAVLFKEDVIRPDTRFIFFLSHRWNEQTKLVAVQQKRGAVSPLLCFPSIVSSNLQLK